MRKRHGPVGGSPRPGRQGDGRPRGQGKDRSPPGEPAVRKFGVTDLTPAEVELMGRSLRGTAGNVYTLLKARYGLEPDEAVFDLLRKHASLFRCELCSLWLPVGDECLTDVCQSCTDR